MFDIYCNFANLQGALNWTIDLKKLSLLMDFHNHFVEAET